MCCLQLGLHWLLTLLLGFLLAMPAGAQALEQRPDELAWIAANPSVEVVVLDGHAPYLQRRADGSASGFTIDG